MLFCVQDRPGKALNRVHFVVIGSNAAKCKENWDATKFIKKSHATFNSNICHHEMLHPKLWQI